MRFPFVISADEKTSIQARRRKHSTLPPASGRPMRVEHEYGRCETTTGIGPFDRLVEQVMTRPPYNDARRVFWIVDNWESTAKPFEWKFTKADLANLLAKISVHEKAA